MASYLSCDFCHPLTWGFASPATPALATPSQVVRGSVHSLFHTQGFRLRPAGYAETGTPWASVLATPPDVRPPGGYRPAQPDIVS